MAHRGKSVGILRALAVFEEKGHGASGFLGRGERRRVVIVVGEEGDHAGSVRIDDMEEDLEVTEGTALGSLVRVRGVRRIAHAVFTVVDAVFVIGKNVLAEHGGLVRRGAMVHGSDQAVT